MNVKIAGCAAVLCLALSGAAQAQSFNCRGNLKPDERAVCDDRTLAQLDVQMNNIYKRAMSKATPRGRQQLQAQQVEWLRTRADCGAQRQCLLDAYRDQIEVLRQYD